MKSNITIKKNSITMFFMIILFRILTDYSYLKVITITYSYYGFVDNRTIIYLIISWIELLLFAIPIIKVLNKKITFSNIIVSVISLISIIPFTTLIYCGMLNNRFIIMNTIYWMVFLIVYLIVSKKEVDPIVLKINNHKFNDRFAFIIGIMSIILVIIVSWKYTGLRFNFSLDNVYDLRMEARTYNMPTIINYLFEWSRSINLILLAYSLTKRKYYTALLFFIAQMIAFGIDGLKSPILMTVFIIAFYFINNKHEIKRIKDLCLYGITGVSFVGVIENIVLKSSNIIELFIRRIMIIPVYLNSCYVDFFSKNTPDYFQRSILRIFGFKTSYPNLEFTIGEIYLNRPLMRCNNGLISDAVTNFGIIGIIISPIIFVFLLRIMDKCTKGLSKDIYFIIALYFAIKLTDTFLTVGLFTHGFLISMLLMAMLKERNDNIENNEVKK